MPQSDLEQLRQENAELRSELASLRNELRSALKTIESLKTENKNLKTELEKLKRKNAKQATPFSRNTPNPKPKSAGRKAGQGNFTYKTAPTPNEVTAIVEVALLEPNCLKCGVELPNTPSSTRVALILEMPRITQQITEYRLEQKVCDKCGITITAKHARVAQNQTGSTAYRVSPEVMAMAHVLQYEKGITARKTPAVLELMTGLRLGQSAITQATVRNSVEGKVIGKSYKQIRHELLKDEQINTDDTGWRVNGLDSYLMTAVSTNSVVFQIRNRHTAKEVLEMIPSSYQGVLGTDRFKTYNVPDFAALKQQKCLFHIIKNLKTELETLKGRARDFPLALRKQFKAVLNLHQKYARQAVTVENYQKQGKNIKFKISKLLTARNTPLCVSSERIRVGLEYHHGHGNLLRFLDNPTVSPTNNAAEATMPEGAFYGQERALRHNVIFRKLCGGSKTQSGARALEAYSTVIQTAKRRGQKPVEVLARHYAEQIAEGR